MKERACRHGTRLLSGDADSTRKAGKSVAGRVFPEDSVPVGDLIDHITTWTGTPNDEPLELDIDRTADSAGHRHDLECRNWRTEETLAPLQESLVTQVFTGACTLRISGETTPT